MAIGTNRRKARRLGDDDGITEIGRQIYIWRGEEMADPVLRLENCAAVAEIEF
jgi:hypothetical protein